MPVGNEIVLAAVESAYKEEDNTSSTQIRITEQKNGRDSRKYRYHIDQYTDHEALRDDFEYFQKRPKYDDLMKKLDFGSDTLIADIQFNMTALKNAVENQRLEKQMGINDQPVGPEEIDKLRQFLEGARTHKLY